jgi:hypothetical protein
MSTNRPLGTLGFHLDGRQCRVGCAYCYLAARTSVPRGRSGPPETEAGPRERTLDPALAAAIVGRAAASDIAVAISEPASRWRAGLEAIVAAGVARGLPVAVTTTSAVLASDPWVTRGAGRLTVSVDPAKGTVDVAALRRVLAGVARADLEIVALPSLVTPAYAEALADGLLAELLGVPEIDLVALNGLKPPPPWCDVRFWLRFLARVRPLLDLHLGRRLHLDCYVSARVLGLSGCPAKPDVAAGREFRACVYQAAPDFVFIDAEDLARRIEGYRAPERCPFPIQ